MILECRQNRWPIQPQLAPLTGERKLALVTLALCAGSWSDALMLINNIVFPQLRVDTTLCPKMEAVWHS
jgi:hypothetical protein